MIRRNIGTKITSIAAIIILTACGGGGGGGGGVVIVPAINAPEVNNIFNQPPSADTSIDNGIVVIPSQNIRSTGSNIQSVQFTQTIEQGEITESRVQIGQQEFLFTDFVQRPNAQAYATDNQGNVALINSESVNTNFEFARILSIASRDRNTQTVSVVFVDASRGLTPNTQATQTNDIYKSPIINPFNPIHLPTQAQVIYHGVIWRQKSEPEALTADNLEDRFAIFEMEVDFALAQGNVNAKVQATDENNVNHFGTFSGNRGNQNDPNSFSGRLVIPTIQFASGDITGKFYGDNAQDVAAIGTSGDAAIAWLGEKGQRGDAGLESGTFPTLPPTVIGPTTPPTTEPPPPQNTIPQLESFREGHPVLEGMGTGVEGLVKWEKDGDEEVIYIFDENSMPTTKILNGVEVEVPGAPPRSYRFRGVPTLPTAPDPPINNQITVGEAMARANSEDYEYLVAQYDTTRQLTFQHIELACPDNPPLPSRCSRIIDGKFVIITDGTAPPLNSFSKDLDDAKIRVTVSTAPFYGEGTDPTLVGAPSVLIVRGVDITNVSQNHTTQIEIESLNEKIEYQGEYYMFKENELALSNEGVPTLRLPTTLPKGFFRIDVDFADNNKITGNTFELAGDRNGRFNLGNIQFQETEITGINNNSFSGTYTHSTEGTFNIKGALYGNAAQEIAADGRQRNNNNDVVGVFGLIGAQCTGECRTGFITLEE